MGKKKSRGQGQQSRKANTINLFEFNRDVTVGQDPELSKLPTAPKLAEEWEAEGGRPEYNARGYKERRVDPYSDDRGVGDDFEDRDWTRRGPVDGGESGGSGFGTGPERDWSMSRQGPLDGPGMGGGAERDVDFGSVRRGPVDAEFGGPGGAARDVDFGTARRGPVEAEFGGPGAGRDVDFGGARKGPIEAEFGAPGGRNVDFGGVRKGPIEADFGNAPRNVDFGGARKGPIDAEFATAPRQVDFAGARKGPIEAEFAGNSTSGRTPDFSQRRGPIEAEFANQPKQRDFGGVRRGPVDADPAPARAPARDFGSMRRAPVQAERPAKNAPTRDFGSMRRGAKLEEEAQAPRQKRQSWKRRNQEDSLSQGVARMNVGAGGGGGERDWGGARRAAPPAAPPAAKEIPAADADDLARARNKPTAQTTVENGVEITTDPNSEWTTVRTNTDKRHGPVARREIQRN